MPLATLPRIERLHLADITRLPEWHPDAATSSGYPSFGYLILHPDGPILVDTGIGAGHGLIDEWYAPAVTSLDAALAAHGIAIDDLMVVINTHLHFDHCGQNSAIERAPIYVQRAEFEAAQQPRYTVPEWAAIPEAQLRLVDGDTSIADGVTLLAAPGHTPGHQSVLVTACDERAVIAGQVATTHEDYRLPKVANSHSPEWHDAAIASIQRLRDLEPVATYFGHDPETLKDPRSS